MALSREIAGRSNLRHKAPACDFCRKRKSRCNGRQAPNNHCTNCTLYSVDCTYYEAAKKSVSGEYIRELENRTTRIENIIKGISPGIDLDAIIDGLDSTKAKSIKQDVVFSPELASVPLNALRSPSLDRDPEDEVKDNFNDPDFVTLRSAPEIAAGSETPMFFGKSSNYYFSHGAVNVKNAMENKHESIPPTVASDAMFGFRRLEYWYPHSWMLPTLKPSETEFFFPEPDLLASLVDLYFNHINIIFPLLHRPTFEGSLAQNLHLHDDSFGATVLMVCAAACRLSEDVRIQHKTTPHTSSTGWQLFSQVRRLRLIRFAAYSIYDLQIYALGAMFLGGEGPPHSRWIMVGVGLRLLQEVGAHRRNMYGSTPCARDELWKRAFWVLLVMDRDLSCVMGRPCALQDEDFDVDLPIECDDEYWTHPDPKLAFIQPLEKPSQLAFFLHFIKLYQILGFALRTIYSIKKSRIILGYVGDESEIRIVAELDSALNKWVDSVPGFLRWEPHHDNSVFFHQSAFLYCHYYQLQILSHRLFIEPRKAKSLSSPSVAICFSAARACFHLIDGSCDRLQHTLELCILPLFSCCIMLILASWRPTRSEDTTRMGEINRCLQILQDCKERFATAKKYRELLLIMLDAPFTDARTKKHYFFSSNAPDSINVSPADDGRSLHPAPEETNPEVEDVEWHRQLEKLFFSEFGQSFGAHSFSTGDEKEDSPFPPQETNPVFSSADLPVDTSEGFPDSSRPMFASGLMAYDNVMNSFTGGTRYTIHDWVTLQQNQKQATVSVE